MPPLAYPSIVSLKVAFTDFAHPGLVTWATIIDRAEGLTAHGLVKKLNR